MEKSVNQRIKELIFEKKMSVSAFARKIGVPQVTLWQQLNGARAVSLITIEKILLTFDDVCADWLLTGRGEMLRSGSVSQRAVCGRGAVHQVATVYNGGSGNGGAACASCTLLAAKEQTIEAQQRMIECLTK